ncbi:type II toxin-antitoxin system RelE/ParE family toxin [Carboxylicivirga sp. M1479]|uniref:type II toxin-antitoxin system RelE/ParE family toxin n=1 Tax=Carboxylicivirga sp. M1479 TaxID=2594476 RepID=UPI0011775119|nr:type II toxin-antitoxin system RelE/ParE family toxin [Carboxylicivirga sp. M1479]TRX72379.1 type II toxin-antitoxin system RelE/ParE family toxin [Carboxylicivirga sp. M1479]
MYKTQILPLAQKDIKEAAVWYNQKQKGLGLRFTQELRKKVHLIAKSPFASPIRYSHVRTTVLNVFPYMIHYVIDESTYTVIIIAVLHTSRNPRLWKERDKKH